MESPLTAVETVSSSQEYTARREEHQESKFFQDTSSVPNLFLDTHSNFPSKKFCKEVARMWEINFDCTRLLSEIIEDYRCCIETNALRRRKEGIKKAKELKEKRSHEAASRKSLRLTQPTRISPSHEAETLSSASTSSLKDLTHTTTDFSAQEEKRVWDSYYQFGRDANKSFTGFGPDTTVQIMRHLLGRRRMIFSDTHILEIGHGLFPCASSLYHAFDTTGVYTGAEISPSASVEALRRCPLLQQLVADGSVEFVEVEGMQYFDKESLFRATVLESSTYSFSASGFSEEEGVHPPPTAPPRLVAGSIHLALAKSTLDYFTCRLDKNGKMSTWEEDLRIPLCVVELFDSLSTALCNPDETGKIKGHLVFVEPSDEWSI
ncbi:hypothetical protein IE077_003276 [Cardiosporidium cionae]|uniref:Uncharacterized protein n=1 Tax=Cardiosporidium cionae TaxID=476202 RepID=A0ABQ7J8M2_9APIC|nr:hypothetical protein IE077_003276 [Cardiosporidium cionae]|eukprot:KAF8820341.1 hypothetical protein IE077_003276 [Cardiosporidium cionae]